MNFKLFLHFLLAGLGWCFIIVSCISTVAMVIRNDGTAFAAGIIFTMAYAIGCLIASLLKEK